MSFHIAFNFTLEKALALGIYVSQFYQYSPSFPSMVYLLSLALLFSPFEMPFVEMTKWKTSLRGAGCSPRGAGDAGRAP